jgi:hypothetical protein
MLLDSNIIIYAHKPEYQVVRDLLKNRQISTSAISYLETLGYHRINQNEKAFLQQFFAVATLLPVSETVIQRATTLRQQRKMSLGDAIIAATALIYNKTLATRNTDDFDWIDGLKVLDPFLMP